MQRDMHFYCMAVLAKSAGFSNMESLLIAYASQYIDNATEGHPITVGDIFFDPTRTAHYGLKSYDWWVQKETYIPFHFLPEKPLRHTKGNLITVPDSEFAHNILDFANKEENQTLRLIRLGIGFHTYADTFSHQGFLGAEDEENEVTEIHYIDETGKEKHLPLKELYQTFLPKIGHAKALHYPDFPFLSWKAKVGKKNIERSNLDVFYDGVNKIYSKLCSFNPDKANERLNWEDISSKIKGCLSFWNEDLDARCKKWQDTFTYLFEGEKYHYDHLDWRQKALLTNNIPSDQIDSILEKLKWDEFESTKFKDMEFEMDEKFFDSLWVLFHKAALKQRNYVLENLL